MIFDENFIEAEDGDEEVFTAAKHDADCPCDQCNPDESFESWNYCPRCGAPNGDCSCQEAEAK